MQQAAEVKVGLFVVVVVALGVFIASSLKGGVSGGSRGYEFEIWFESAPGVGKGSPVRLAGVDIGEIIEKDIVQVTESVSFGVPTQVTVLPLELVRTWSVGSTGEKDYCSVVVQRRPISIEDSRKVREFRRQRSVAYLKVRVKRDHKLYTNYRYEIVGGVVFGDKQLNVSDVGPGGLPLDTDERGDAVPELIDSGRRVAVLGQGPPDLDAIVGNVEKVVDEDTTARVKNIVQNIETATDEAARLVAGLRGVVQANQGNADLLMANLAKASEDVQQTMAEARVTAADALANLEGMTRTGRRLAEANEARLNRIAANVEDGTGSLSRMAKKNEENVDRTMTDVAAIAREVRGMIASNRDNIDNLAARLSATAENVQAITGESREHVKSVMANTDASVKKIRALLDDSDADLRAMVADARKTVSTVKESVEPLAGNLREASDNLKTASKNVAELTGDPTTKQILSNVERTTAEARELIGDVRALTADPKVQEDIRATAHHLRSVTERVDDGLGGVKSFRPSAFADVYYVPDTSSWRGDVNVSIQGKGRTSYHVGMDNVTNDPVWNLQLGKSILTPDLRVRYGFYRGQLGLGADYRLWPGARLKTDYFNFGNPQFNARFTYKTPFGLTGLVGVEDVFDRFDWTWGIQLGRDLR